MHIVDDSEVNRVLSFPVLIEAIEAAHRRPKIAVHDSYLGDDKGQQLVTRSAVDAGRFMMTKLYTSFRRCRRSACCSTAMTAGRSR